MQWQVTGAHRDTGENATVVVEAHSQGDASEKASAMGLLIIEVARHVPAPRIAPPAAPVAAPAYTPARQPVRTPRRGEIICANPNCGFVGKPKRKAKGNILVFLILLLLFVVPAILYLLFMGGAYHVCPKCGNRVGR